MINRPTCIYAWIRIISCLRMFRFFFSFDFYKLLTFMPRNRNGVLSLNEFMAHEHRLDQGPELYYFNWCKIFKNQYVPHRIPLRNFGFKVGSFNMLSLCWFYWNFWARIQLFSCHLKNRIKIRDYCTNAENQAQTGTQLARKWHLHFKLS